MTTESDNKEGTLISATNPQGALPDVPVDSKSYEEQMDFFRFEKKNPEAFVEFNMSPAVEEEPIDTIQKPLTESESLSLPAALCDDQLLSEIQNIPDKMGFKIGDVADMLAVKQYVLRYWESEFDILKPKKAGNNQRLYTKKDVENAFLIRKLLHRDRFSIEGARAAMKNLKSFVRKENKKEMELKQAFNKIETFHHDLEDIAQQIRRVRQLFKLH